MSGEVFLWPDESRGPWSITLEFGLVGSRNELIRLEIAAIDPRNGPLTTSVLRQLPLASLAADVRKKHKAATEDLVDLFGGNLSARDVAEMRRLWEDPHRRGPKGHPPEQYRDVALVYADAYRAGDNPRVAVMNHFEVAKDTAAKWVQRARELGFLGQTVKGRAGGVHGMLEGNLFQGATKFSKGAAERRSNKRKAEA
jgi:hypothetical protein